MLYGNYSYISLKNSLRVKCIAKFYVAKCNSLYFFIKLWLLFSKFLKKTRFSQVVAIGQYSIYKNYQLSVVNQYSVSATQNNVDFTSCSLAVSWRYVGTLEQFYCSFNIISYQVSHRHTIPYQKNGSMAPNGIAQVLIASQWQFNSVNDDGRMTEYNVQR